MEDERIDYATLTDTIRQMVNLVECPAYKDKVTNWCGTWFCGERYQIGKEWKCIDPGTSGKACILAIQKLMKDSPQEAETILRDLRDLKWIEWFRCGRVIFLK